jgi:hypothetical protein
LDRSVGKGEGDLAFTNDIQGMKESVFLTVRSLAFAFFLATLAGRLSAQKALRIKYQDWEEDQDRIRVRSWYAESEVKLGQGWNIGVIGLVDTISGATPMGRPPTGNPSDWLVEIEEERRAGIVTLSGKKEDYEFSFEFGLSDEPDYLSRSYAINVSRGFAEDTLSLYGGFSYSDDEVDSGVPGGPGLGMRGKRTPEIMLGVSRILDAKTTLSLNLSYGCPKGYLSDPYKQIGLTEVLFPGDPVREREEFYLYPENRPEERETFVAYLEGVRFFEKMDASVETSYRYFCDDAGLEGHTLEIQWFQRMGEKVVFRPIFRHYLQRAADFYRVSLDGSGITPSVQPDGSSPFYSADYRLSKLRTSTYGLKLTYFHRDDLSFDLAWDRYLMSGRDGSTSQLVYPDAKVLTLGFQYEF